MTDRIKSVFQTEIPSWALWIISVSATALVGVVVFASTASADMHNDGRYIAKIEYVRDWSNHDQKHVMKEEMMKVQIGNLEQRINDFSEQLKYNTRLTERNNSILERLDKK